MKLEELESLPVFDEANTKSMRDFLGDDFHLIIEEFKLTTPQLLTNIRFAAESNNLIDVTDIAHRLKSGSGNLGLEAFSRVCQFLEEGLRDEADLDINLVIDAVERQFHRILEYCDNEL